MAEVKINEQYFSGAQASIFIGDTWVDDIITIDMAIATNRAPIYGYGSQFFDFVPKGAVLVTGQFTINFREPNYLWLILERNKEFDPDYRKQLKFKEELEEKLREKQIDPAISFGKDKRANLDLFFNSDDASQAAKILKESSGLVNVSQTQARDQTRFNHRSFDILIGYGAELNADTIGEKIQTVILQGKGKSINSDGRPILEQYNFIARNMI